MARLFNKTRFGLPSSSGPEFIDIYPRDTGYCRSTGKLISDEKDKQGLLRMFEAPNYKYDKKKSETNIWQNFKVFWLAKGNSKFGLQHILERHGYKVNLKDQEENFHTKFNQGDDIIDIIKTTVLNSHSINGSRRSLFEKTFNKAWFDKAGLDTNKIRVIGGNDSRKESNGITSAFPLSRINR